MRFMTESRQTGGLLKRHLLSFSSFLLATIVGLVSSFTFSAVYDMAHTALYTEPQTISGVWRGSWHGVPAVTIRLEQQGDLLRGTAQFNTVIATKDGPQAASETKELQLENVRFDGERLSFEVWNTDESNTTIVARMEMRFENRTEAELRRTGGQPEGSPEDKEMGIKMKRERSF